MTAQRFPVRPVALLLAAAALCSQPAAQARDGVALEAGYGQHVDLVRASFTRDWNQPLATGEAWLLGAYWDLTVGHWHPHYAGGGNHDVNDIGLTPVLRITERQRSAIAPYAEAGIGAHLISEHHLYDGRDMSTNFQFGDHIGAGVSFGDQYAWDLGVRVQHLSNAGIKNPNPGINFLQVRAAYHF